MKTPRQPETTDTRTLGDWSPETVLAMNLVLLLHPALDVQQWFEEQVAAHLGCSPHGACMTAPPII